MAKRAVDDRRDEDVSYPRLSTTDRGGRITQLPPGRTPGRFDGVMAAECAAAVLFWAAGTGMLAAALFEQPGSALGSALGQPGPVVAALVLAVLALFATVALRHRIAEDLPLRHRDRIRTGAHDDDRIPRPGGRLAAGGDHRPDRRDHRRTGPGSAHRVRTGCAVRGPGGLITDA